MCGSSQPSTPTSSGTTISELPEWAKGYAKDTLYQASQLTDINKNPYQPYEGQRNAGLSPMQMQAMQGASDMQVSNAVGAGQNMAGAAGMAALGANYVPSIYGNQFNPQGLGYNAQTMQGYQMGPAERVSTQSFAQPGAADAYMSPYMQNVVDIQKREAQRQSAIQGTQQQAQAVGAGAFGGSRDAIQRAERERNLSQQMGDIQAQGSQAAYQQAMGQFNQEQQARLAAQQANQQAGLTTGIQNLGAAQQTGLANQAALNQAGQFNAGQNLQAAGMGAQYGQAANQLNEQSRQYGAGYGLQGLQTGLQAAGQLGTLGQNEYTQNMGINQLQSGYGGMQQAQLQKELDTQYGDFQAQMNYPYKQLGFMSDAIRGLPVGTQSANTMYQAPGSTLGQLGGLGVTALGLSRYMADGGEVHGYAGGGAIDAGEDVDSEENIANILHMKSDAELRASAQAAAQRGDREQLRLIEEEFAMRASLKNGMASVIPSNMIGMADDGGDVPAGANGGIVAFAEKGAVDLGEILDQAREADKNAQKKLYSYGLQQRLQDPQGFAAAQAAKQAAANARATAEKAYAAEMEAKGVNKLISAAVPIGAFQIGKGVPSGLPAAAVVSKGPTNQRPAGDSSGFKAYEPPRQQAAAPAAGGGGGGGGGGRPSGSISDLHPAIAATVDKALADMAASGNVGGGSLLSNYKSMMDMISQGNNADLQVLKDQITKGDQQVDETKGQALGNVLMAFGANWAANASKPGATFMSSAAASAPAAQQEMATQDKILRDMNDVQNKIKMDYTKFQISLKKQDQGTALQAATDMARNEIAAAQLAQQAAASRGDLRLKGIQLQQQAETALADIDYKLKSLGIQGSQVAYQNRRIGVDEKRLEVQERLAGVQEKKLRALAMKQFDADPKNQKDYRDLQKTNPKDADFLMGQRRNAYVEDATGFGLSSGLGSGGIRDNTQY